MFHKVRAESSLFFVIVISFSKYTHGDSNPSKYQQSMEHWPGFCSLNQGQSPINIVDKETLKYDSFDPIVINNLYEIIFKVTMMNNGKGVTITDFDTDISVYGGPLRGEFLVDHIDFRSMSEHRLNGEQYALECEIICRNKLYTNFTEAVRQVHGVAVLSILYHLTENKFENFKDIAKAITEVQHFSITDRVVQLGEFYLGQVLPRIGPYFTYTGSLTTPNCNDGVVWIVFRNTYPIGSDIFQAFRSIEISENEPIGNNFRSLKPTFDRTIVLSETNFLKEINLAARFRLSTFIFCVSLSSLKAFDTFTKSF